MTKARRSKTKASIDYPSASRGKTQHVQSLAWSPEEQNTL